jgi:hypothetical protein
VAAQPNRVRIVTFNQDGYLSSRGTLLNWGPRGEAAAAAPKLYAIVAGISNYSSPVLKLRYAAKDASEALTAERKTPMMKLGLCICSLTLAAQLWQGSPAVSFARRGPGTSPVSAGGHDVKEVRRGIKTLAEAEAAAPSRTYIRPRFTIKTVGSTTQLTMNRGEIGDLGFGDDPYGVPIRKQILIETLRRALADARLEDVAKRGGAGESRAPAKPGAGKAHEGTAAAAAAGHWQCYLDQAEQLVGQSVIAIETVTDKQQLQQLLQGAEDQIDELLYNKLFASIEEYAKSRGYNVIYERGGDAAKPFAVPFSSAPDGAKLWVMTDLVYRKQLIIKVDRSQWPWTELVQNPVNLLGKYQYMAVWPDGRRSEGSFEVTSGNALKFTPQ